MEIMFNYVILPISLTETFINKIKVYVLAEYYDLIEQDENKFDFIKICINSLRQSRCRLFIYNAVPL